MIDPAGRAYGTFSAPALSQFGDLLELPDGRVLRIRGTSCSMSSAWGSGRHEVVAVAVERPATIPLTVVTGGR